MKCAIGPTPVAYSMFLFTVFPDHCEMHRACKWKNKIIGGNKWDFQLRLLLRSSLLGIGVLLEDKTGSNTWMTHRALVFHGHISCVVTPLVCVTSLAVSLTGTFSVAMRMRETAGKWQKELQLGKSKKQRCGLSSAVQCLEIIKQTNIRLLQHHKGSHVWPH